MVQTLTEAKAERAAKEKAELEAANKTENATDENEDLPSPQDGEAENETGAVEDEQANTSKDAESEEEEASETETEDWMKGDDHESQAEKKYSGSDIGNAKAKLRAKLDKKLDAKDSENEKLRAEIEALKSRPKSEKLVKPKREDFEESDEPEEAYFDALTDWKLERHQAESQANQAGEATARQQQQQAETISKAVDQHYEDAVILAEKSGISADVYHAADLKVRQAVESIFPNAGDNVMDGLIANLGKGSEKVMFNLGVNTAKREEFAKILQEDKTGLRAMGFLGSLKADLNAPSKRKTNAPAPAPDANGDAQESGKFKAAQKKYDAAHKSGNTQEAFTIKREAKKAGCDTNKW